MLTLKNWYEQRKLREKLFILALNAAILYFLFYFILFRSIETEETILTEQIKLLNTQVLTWQNQIVALQKLALTPQYKKWLSQRKSFQSLQGQYKFLLQSSATQQWQDVIKTILASQENISLLEIQNLPETPYTVPGVAATLYQQKLQLAIYSSYFDTLKYLEKLEQVLPNIHWDSLDYDVAQYPLAKVTMEFSILYEKSNA